MAGKGPVLLEHTGRGFHAAGLELVDQILEGVKRLIILGIEFLAGDGLDRVGVVHQAAGLNADGEPEDLAAHGDGLGGVGDPIFIAQVDRVLGAKRVDVLGVNHRQHVWIVGGVASG